MAAIDGVVLHWLNQHAGRSCAFDAVVLGVLERPVVKAVPLLALVWWVLKSEERYRADRRHDVIGALILGPPAFFVARLLTLLLPFRDRPLHDAAAGVRLACGFSGAVLEGWSSFPSDHATLYFMLATTVGFASRRLGYAAAAWVTAVVILPRVYLGLHWPSDILGGAVLGFACANVARTPVVRAAVRCWGGALRAAYPGAFHAALFLLSYLVATHFGDVRALVRAALRPDVREVAGAITASVAGERSPSGDRPAAVQPEAATLPARDEEVAR